MNRCLWRAGTLPLILVWLGRDTQQPRMTLLPEAPPPLFARTFPIGGARQPALMTVRLRPPPLPCTAFP